MSKLQPAVKKETLHVTLGALICTVLMCVIYFVLSLIFPEDVSFSYTVILGGVAGSFLAVLNFFLMAVTVQKVAGTENEDDARKLMKLSYTRRLGLQLLWIIAAVLAPCFDTIAGIVPLLFPGFTIKVMGILKRA